MSAKPGRNDPCYCGSGKKYKRCHLPLDEQARLTSTGLAPEGPAAEPLPKGLEADDMLAELTDEGASPALQQFAKAYKTASRSGLFQRDPKLREMFKENQTLLVYMAHQAEIEAASKALVPYHAEFDQLCRDAEAYGRQAKALFTEPAFAPFRFTAEELRQVFAQVGVPVLDDTSKKTTKLLRQALLHLATEKRRHELAMRLLLLLPDYVRQSRHMDALLIEFCAQMTAEKTQDTNPFLGQMFLCGLEAWAAEQDASRAAVLREAGFHLGPEADIEEIESWMEENLDKPENAARWRHLLEAHPELQDDSSASLQSLARAAVKLLDHPDAARLFLSVEELEPWQPFLLEQLQGMMNVVGPLEPGAKATKAQSKKVFNQFYLPALRKMVKSIFTPERIQRLIAELRAYRKELAAAGDKAAALSAASAIVYLNDETEPEQNVFLVNLCSQSLMAISAEEPEADDAADADPAKPAE